jgi:peptidoglycan hydrolase-like protein with peptidoglycan-binding domain
MLRKNSLIGFFCVLFSFVLISVAFSQSFSRTIELRNPRMNGPDISNLQNRLLSLGFSEIGTADGYYGPLAEDLIKNIQTFSGFEIDGKVNRTLWDYIFNDGNASFLRNIRTILGHNPMRLIKSRDFLNNGEPIDGVLSAVIYYSATDGKPKILEYRVGSPMNQTSMTCYFIDDNYYFVKYVLYNWALGGPIEEMLYLVNGNNRYEIVNGVMGRTDNDVVYPINGILNTFRAENR